MRIADLILPVFAVILTGWIVGLTGYLYNQIIVPYGNTLNNPATFNAVKIPGLGDIPVLTLTPENDAPQLMIEEIRRALRAR